MSICTTERSNGYNTICFYRYSPLWAGARAALGSAEIHMRFNQSNLAFQKPSKVGVGFMAKSGAA